MADLGFGGSTDEARHRSLHQCDVVLDGTNYLAWRLTLRLLLDGLRVWGHVAGTVTLPPSPVPQDSFDSSLDDGETHSISPAALEDYEKRLEKWYANDSKAKVLICQTVTLGIRSQIAELPTAKSMWDYLARRYSGSSQAQLYTLYQSLSGL